MNANDKERLFKGINRSDYAERRPAFWLSQGRTMPLNDSQLEDYLLAKKREEDAKVPEGRV